MIVGTGVGGLLAQPAVHHPSLFSATGLFGRLVFIIGYYSLAFGSIGRDLPIVSIVPDALCLRRNLCGLCAAPFL